MVLHDQFTNLYLQNVIAVQMIQFFFTIYMGLKTFRRFRKKWRNNVDKVKEEIFFHYFYFLTHYFKTPYIPSLKGNCFSYFFLNQNLKNALDVKFHIFLSIILHRN